MVPVHFHDVDGDLSDHNVMLPAHFDDVTYDQILSKILQELMKSPAKNTRAIFGH